MSYNLNVLAWTSAHWPCQTHQLSAHGKEAQRRRRRRRVGRRRLAGQQDRRFQHLTISHSEQRSCRSWRTTSNGQKNHISRSMEGQWSRLSETRRALYSPPVGQTVRHDCAPMIPGASLKALRHLRPHSTASEIRGQLLQRWDGWSSQNHSDSGHDEARLKKKKVLKNW